MASAAQLKAQAKYDKTHTRTVLLKLNLTTDADILSRLDEVHNRQGYIKSLIRKDVRGVEGIPSIDAIRTLLLPVVRKFGIRKLYLFGSYARGEADISSDVDLLIEGHDGKGMMKFLELQELMEHSIGKKVDLVESEAVLKDNSRAGRRFRDHIERDKVLLYG